MSTVTVTGVLAGREPSKPFFCTACRRWWQTVQWGVSCCVAHPPGTCCHYNDREVEKPQGKQSLMDIDFGSFP